MGFTWIKEIHGGLIEMDTEKMNNKMSIMIIGYDGYSDLWNTCISLIKKFWDDCPYEILFINNVKDVSWDGVKTIHAGLEAEWSRKVQIGLQNTSSNYICLLLEDFFVGSRICTTDVEMLLKIMIDNKTDYMKLVDMNEPIKSREDSIIECKDIHRIKNSDYYGISLQPSIWNRAYLISLLGTDNYNAWIFEKNRVDESDSKDDTYRKNALFDTRNILNIKHGVIRGKLLPGTIQYFTEIGIPLNIDREIMPKTDYIKIRAVAFAKNIVPKRIRKRIKEILRNNGMKFLSTESEKRQIQK